jgi:hypothetical protein
VKYLLSSGYKGLFPWGWSERGVKLTTHLHLVPRSKNEWNYTSAPQYAFMVWCLVKVQGQIYIYLYLCLQGVFEILTCKIVLLNLVIYWTNCTFGLYPSSGVSKNWVIYPCVNFGRVYCDFLVYIFYSSIFWDTRRWIKSKSTIRSI